MALRKITKKVLSYCEIPQEVIKSHWIEASSPDCYVEYILAMPTVDCQYEISDLDKWIMDTYPELIDTSFLIHIDY